MFWALIWRVGCKILQQGKIKTFNHKVHEGQKKNKKEKGQFVMFFLNLCAE
jgi:hypothetical protein